MKNTIDQRYVDVNLNKEANIVCGYRCNNNCRFCCEGWNRNVKEKSTDQVKEDLERAKRDNVKRVLFTGGEPTIRGDILDLVSYANQLGFEEIFIISNGRMFSYGKFTNGIIKAGMTNVLFSLVGHNAKLHDYLTRSKGSFNQIIKGIKNVKNNEKHIIVGNNTSIVNPNLMYLPNIANLLVSLLDDRGDYFEFIFVNPFGNAYDNFEEIVPNLRSIPPYLHKALSIGLRNNIKVTAESMPFCYMQGYEKYVTELQMSLERSKITPKGDKDDLNLARREGAKIKGPQCSKCRFDSICEGLWRKYAEKRGFSELKPVPGGKISSWDEFRRVFFKIQL